jgi:4'-phosphopantetheinyl transferase
MMTDPNHLWLPAPVVLSLSRDEIHVWRASLDLNRPRAQGLEHTLTPDEVGRAKRYRFPKDRERFIVARGLLRAILGRYLNTAPAQLRFCYGPSGKPAVAAQSGGNGIHFNLSHSHNLALYAVARNRRVGIDLEHIHPIPEISGVVEQFFSSQEKAVFRALAPDKQLAAFFRCWTRKEAYIKARGQGLALALDQFDVSIAPGKPARLLKVSGDRREASHWSLCELLPAYGYVAALAVEGHGWSLSCWQWTE